MGVVQLQYFHLDLFLVFRSSLGLRRFSGVMTVVIIIMGILGNGLTIAALIKCKKIRNLTVAFIIRLVITCRHTYTGFS